MKVTVANPIGAGDSFLGGLAAELSRENTPSSSWLTAARYGLAAGSAAVENVAAGILDRDRATELYQELLAGTA